MKKLNLLAHLTPAENKTWTTAFEYHVNNGKTDRQSDALAWKETAREHPRLKKYVGAKT